MIQFLPQADRDDWLLQRKKFITASDVPALLGESRWRTRAEVIAEKAGQPRSFEDNLRMYFGRIGEAHVLLALQELTGIAVTPNSLLMVNSEVPGLAATPDALADLAFLPPSVPLCASELIFHSSHATLIKHRRAGHQAVIDVKVVASRNRSKWKTQEPPTDYYGQLQAQMLVAGVDIGLLVAKVDAHEIYGYAIEADPFYQEMIQSDVAAAWIEIKRLTNN